MEHPRNIELPFFAYGLFRPGQLAFFQLVDLVSEITDPVQISGSLLLRDGLPIIDPAGHGSVNGALLTFAREQAAAAYDRISAMEPDKQYRWDKAQANGNPSNVLVGRYPKKGSVSCEDDEWNGWNDPLFTAALEVVGETLASQEFNWDMKPIFRLQMAYLLLWSSIERYVSLRYHLGRNVMQKVGKLADEPAFAEGLLLHVKKSREVYRADRPSERVTLDPRSPSEAVDYYYQVRSNITHRGKGVVRDYELLRESLTELLPIFREVLSVAQRDSRYSAWRRMCGDSRET